MNTITFSDYGIFRVHEIKRADIIVEVRHDNDPPTQELFRITQIDRDPDGFPRPWLHERMRLLADLDRFAEDYGRFAEATVEIWWSPRGNDLAVLRTRQGVTATD